MTSTINTINANKVSDTKQRKTNFMCGIVLQISSRKWVVELTRHSSHWTRWVPDVHHSMITLFLWPLFCFLLTGATIPIPGGRSLHPVKNGGRKIEMCFPLHCLHSLHWQTRFFSYKFKIFVHFNDFIRGDWWLYFPEDLLFPQNNYHASQGLAFGMEWARLFRAIEAGL